VAFQVHDIVERQMTQKWYKIEQYLQWQTDKKSYKAYRILPFTLTVNDRLTQIDFKIYVRVCSVDRWRSCTGQLSWRSRCRRHLSEHHRTDVCVNRRTTSNYQRS